MLFGNKYFGLCGKLGHVDRDGYHLFDRWLKKRSGGRGSKETSGRCRVDGRYDR